MIVVFTISAASANDNVSAPTGNFTELNGEIQLSNDTISLDKDYAQQSNEDQIIISKSMNIEGNNHTLDSGKSDVFEIAESNISLVLKDIKFKNSNLFSFKDDVENVSITFIGCDIPTQANSINPQITPEIENVEHGTSGKISSAVKKKAFEIVGKSTGIEAAKKLAKWVRRNIKHETAPGFYQSPEKTLSRKKGNCCCHSDLFLQMCEAVGVTKTCKLSFVHVGTMKFGQRHFFCLVNGICVDTDTGLSLNPWGVGDFKNSLVYSITDYPNLPLPREY